MRLPSEQGTDMTPQQTKAQLFHALHVKGDPLVLYNIWDPGSAKAVAEAGARALATGSLPVALALGFADGEKTPLALALDNFRRIVANVDVPVSMDIESGFGATPAAVAETATLAIAAGAVGFNFEDQIIGATGLYDIASQCARIAAIRAAAETAGINIFINARTDIFLKAKPETHDVAMVDAAIVRAHAYAAAGASGFFAPGLRQDALIQKLCADVGIPVNIIVLADTPSNDRMAELGVARISYGPGPYRQMMAALTSAAANIYGASK
jgi:2-methylisocitrate lyase-like PEP mutase family enzyme